MNQPKIHLIRASVSGFFLFFVDQTAKWIATHSTISFYIIKPFIGWELLLNPGVAFGLPIPNWLIVMVTPFILLTLALFLAKKYHEPKTPATYYYALSFILSGALSNYIDRVITSTTIDYIRILYSVINVADISIVLGLILLLISDVDKSA